MNRNKYLLLVLLFTGIHFFLYNYFKKKVKETSPLIAALEKYKNAPSAKTKVLLMGDSHIERSVISDSLPYASSLAFYGENNVMVYYRLKFLLQNNYPKPQYIVLPSDVVTFSKGLNVYRTNKYFYYSFIPISELRNFEENKLMAYYDYIKQKIFPYAEWQTAFNLNNANRKAKGSKKFSDKTKAEREANAAHVLQNELDCRRSKAHLFYPTALTYLEKTIALCKENGIKPVFVRFPLTREIFDEIRINVDSTYLANRPSQKIIRKNNLPILDFEKMYAERPEFFFDSHHLNDSGKVNFTPVFRAKLDSLLQKY